jgi:hypothetical protein
MEGHGLNKIILNFFKFPPFQTKIKVFRELDRLKAGVRISAKKNARIWYTHKINVDPKG